LELAEHLHVPVTAVSRLGDELAGKLLVEREGEERRIVLGAPGRAALDRLSAARRKGLGELLGGWSPDEHDEVVQMVARLASDLMSHAVADSAMISSPGPAG
jgi:DNA-binding MarR family transcriptional regulator